MHSVETKIKDLPVIVLETIASLNAIEKHKDRLIEIASDCAVNEDEMADFSEIQSALRKISASAYYADFATPFHALLIQRSTVG